MCEPNKQSQFTQQTQVIQDCNVSLGVDTAGGDQNKPDEGVWGRLIPIASGFKQFDLKKDVVTIGRKADCDVILANDSVICAATAYSNCHFKIKREFSIKTGSHALLEDNSSNGTFIDGEKLGKGRIQALKNNNEIALARKENKAYIFIENSKEEAELPPQIRNRYIITKTLGVGAYGEVKLAFEKGKESCEKCAIKIIKKNKFTINGRNQMNLNSQIMAEVNILKKLQHPCIIKIKDVVDSPETVFIILELVEGGELFDKVIKIGQYSEATAKLLFFQMVHAIKYLHDQGISHRDLKPENILLSSPDANDTLIKVTDFGLSKFFGPTDVMKTFCGTPNYLAPEVLKTKGESSYTNKIDNWSLGVILYICLVGYPPFSEEDTTRSLERQIIEGRYDFPTQFWGGISKQAIDLIKRLMCVDPAKRATLEQVLEHPWIKNDREMQEKAFRLMYPNGKHQPQTQQQQQKQANSETSHQSAAKRLKTSSSLTSDESSSF